jgi:hypothetical protein
MRQGQKLRCGQEGQEYVMLEVYGPLTLEQVRRVKAAIVQLYKLLGKELSYPPDLRKMDLVNEYIKNVRRLESMI